MRTRRAAGTWIRRIRLCGIGLAGLAGLAGCRTSESLTLVLPSGQVLKGGATTSINGQYSVRDGNLTCYGTFEGRTVVGVGLSFRRPAPVTVNCSDGRRGTSEDLLYDTGQAVLKFQDGKTGRLSLTRD